MTKSDPPFGWTGAVLKAARVKARLTQAQVAELAGIDRSRYNGLETGTQRLTPYYADKLAPPLKKKAAELLPPEADGGGLEDPLVLLRLLQSEHKKLRQQFDNYVRATAVRLADVEAAQGQKAPRSVPKSRQRVDQ